MTTDKYPDLVRKLKEIFQIDRPELDFGVYRVLNARRREIEEFLDNRLKARVETALNASAVAERDAVAAELRKAEEGARALGVDPASVPKVKALGDRLAALSGAASDAESVVYANLLAFFSRYYEGGDFISQRRYKDGVYAIPYSGEEVKLHWANADQYYTKTGEAFTNYDFPLDGGLRVRFRLVSADTAKDNAKDNDAVRRFKLWDPADTPAFDPDDEEAAERIKAQYPADFIEERDGELWIYFQYLKFPKSQKQPPLLDDAARKIVEAVSTRPALRERWGGVLAPAPTASDRSRTLLRKHLEDYAAKNSSDYFIHKDLRAFLRRELDFYVKNEMMRLDEVEAADFDRDLAPRLRTIRAFRAVAHDLIDFMAQLEEFQKKLWLKRKFVVQCDWCITMDLVPEKLRDEVLANEAQQAEWKRLGVDAEPKADNLTATDARMVDTKFFDETFKAKLLAAIPDLDARTDGVLVHSENFQALRLMQERYKGQVKCIYIDPPYNAQSSEILYKNNFKHSSWLSLISNRIEESLPVFKKDTVQIVAIDEVEDKKLGLLLARLFPSKNNDCISIVHNPTGQQGDGFSYTHEFAYFTFNLASTKLGEENRDEPNRDSKPDVRPLRNVSSGRNHFRDSAATCFYPIFVKGGKVVGFGDVCADSFHPAGINVTRNDGIVEVYPIDPQGRESKWNFGRDTVEGIKSELFAEYDSQKRVWDVIRRKVVFRYKSLWSDKRYSANSYGSAILNQILPNNPFTFPKSIYNVRDCLSIGTGPDKSSIILDYFAGSGTTGHAVIDLNRQDREKGIDANRKYILVEMGEHFDTVLKPRIEKVVYSPDWKDGKPENTDKGISHCFKYLTLESYEDTLNNLELKKPDGAAPDLLGEDEYLLRYMLDVEARGSLLSTDDFRHPFDYGMKIAADSSGAWTRRRIDLVETFNWLVGLRVEHEERRIDRQGVVLVEGTLPSGETALVVWRDCDKADNAALAEILKAQGYLSKADEKPLKDVGTIFVNGDHALAPVLSGETGETKVRQIEEVFLSKMWEER